MYFETERVLVKATLMTVLFLRGNLNFVA